MKPLLSSVIFISIMLVLAACNAQPTSTPAAAPGNPTSAPDQPTSIPTQGNPTPVPAQATTVPTAPVNPTSASACANPYFPSSQAATWTYANTSPMAPDSTTTRNISGVTSTGFFVHDVITPDITVTVKWSCKDGNLIMLESATASAKSIALEVSSANATGYLIPAAITDGGKWSENLEYEGTGKVGKQTMTQDNKTQIDCTADGKVSINVKAGKFDALKVTCIYKLSTTTNVGSTPGTPITNTVTMTDWYVSGIGSVKTEKTGDIIETHELTSYSIP